MNSIPVEGEAVTVGMMNAKKSPASVLAYLPFNFKEEEWPNAE